MKGVSNIKEKIDFFKTYGLFFLCTMVSFHVNLSGGSDIGYELLFASNTDEITTPICQQLNSTLRHLNGSFLLPSVALFELNGQQFHGTFDAYGKLQRFQFTQGEMCFQSRMLQSEFYNTSMKQDTIVPELLFLDSSPSNNYTGLEKMKGANDNNMVNSYELEGKVRMLSDSPLFLDINLLTLEVVDGFMYNDKMVTGGLPAGSAHPIKRSNGCLVNVAPWQSVNDRERMHKAGVAVYETCPNQPYERKELNSYESAFGPNLHSFGITKNYAVLPHQNSYLDMGKYLNNGSNLMDAYVDVDSAEFQVSIVPLNGGDVIQFTIYEKLYYVHVVNSYEIENGVVIDMGTFSSNAYGDGVVDLDWQRNRDRRNNEKNNGTIKRFIIYTDGDNRGSYEITELSPSSKSTEFPVINREYASSMYCFYYAVEWFHDLQDYGSMAIAKQSVCNSESPSHEIHALETPLYWSKSNFYPSEPTFIANENPQSEDDGVLLFTCLNGETDISYLMIVDALTMSTIQEIELPSKISFTLHGQFYKDFLST